MRDEFLNERDTIEDEYELDEELEPEMQGFMQGWEAAGNNDKEDTVDLFGDEE